MKITTFIIILVLTALSATVGMKAQGGSNYTIFGIGDLYDNSSAGYVGLGGTCAAMPSETSINPLNPALWSTVTTTRLQAGYIFNQEIVNSNQQTVRQNNGKINGIKGLFCIDTSLGITVGFGLTPYTSVNYLIAKPFTVSKEGISIDGLETYEGTGGISQAYLGGSIRLFNSLALGVSAFAAFGNVGNSVVTELYDVNSTATFTDQLDNYTGYGFRGGMYFNGIPNLGIGAYIENHQPYKVQRMIDFRSQLLGDSITGYNLGLTIPTLYGAGISYTIGKVLIGADYSIQDFSNLNYQSNPGTKFKQYKHWSLGVSRLGSKSPGSNVYDKTTYNIGAGYNELYYSILGKDMNEYFGSFGVQVPLIGTAMLDAAIQIGTRGTKDNGLLQEYFGRLVIDVSIGETWFKPFHREF
jgi:hypothetical protein